MLLLADEAPSPALECALRLEVELMCRHSNRQALARAQLERLATMESRSGPQSDARASIGKRHQPELDVPPPSGGQVFLFSGHMIDHPERPQPRFPPNREPIAALAIEKQLGEWGATSGDTAICGGACGGDILFAETCRDRGVHLKIFLPFEEPEFLKSSVNFAGTDWERRYFDIRDHPGTETRILSGDLGCGPPDSNPFARNNMRQLYTAFAIGSGKVLFLCLWNRANGDGIGGTKHMYEVVAAQGGETCVLDTNELW